MSEALHDTIQRARALHQRGMLGDAETMYRDVLRLQPDNHDVLHLIGLLALQTDRPAEGVALISQALRLHGNDAGAHCNLGLGLRALQRLEEALASCDRAIALRPNFAQAYSNRGLVLADLRRPEEALASHDRAIMLRPEFADAHANRGVVLAGLRRDEAALASFERAIALRPDHAGSHYNLAKLLACVGRQEDALASYDRAIALRPDYAEAYGNRGNVLVDLQRPEAALASYDRAIALLPEQADAYSSRGYVLADLGRYADALVSCDQAIALRPDHADAYCNRGVVLTRLQRFEAALASYDRAIALDPEHAEAYCNRGVVLTDLRRHADALVSYDRVVALRPDYAEAYWNRSHCLLALGQFDVGWRLFEWRKRLNRPSGHRAFPQPVWLGQDGIAGKTLFIHWEQGLGDTLQFCRYAALATACGARVVMSVQDPLRRVIATLGTDVTVVGGGDVAGEFDWHCPMMSLPLAFGTTVETIPGAVPYLAADAAAVAAWRGRLAGMSGLRVGLCWAGNARADQPAAHAIDQRRSMALARFAPLAGVAGASFVSLQKGDAAGEAGEPHAGLALCDWTDALEDFADTAALIESLDLVITVDTAVAHLAGALGKRVWILNRFDACWRWLVERDDSPWYPTAQVFRQAAPGDWDSVVSAVVVALRGLVQEVAAGAVGTVV
jgi:tetratricopeptide (TPR) repeat protein